MPGEPVEAWQFLKELVCRSIAVKSFVIWVLEIDGLLILSSGFFQTLCLLSTAPMPVVLIGIGTNIYSCLAGCVFAGDS